MTIPALLLGIGLLGYVSVGAEGAAGGLAMLISAALFFLGVLRARRDPEQAALIERIAARALLLLPGAFLVYLSFEAGGFFPGSPALVAVLLALILAARLVLGRGVAQGSRLLATMAVAFFAYTGWVLLSGSWSHAPERALLEADLALVYGLGLVLFATSVTGPGDMRWAMRGVAFGSVVVCLGAFLSRTLPKLWPIGAGLDTPQISYPMTYANALGILATLALVVCVGLTSDDRQSRVSKALSALPIPLLAVTLLLTFSRGAIAAGIAGLIAYLLLGRPRSLLIALIAVAPTTAIALIVAYRATSLAQALDGSSLQASQGRHVALVVFACSLAAAVARGLLAGIDTRLMNLSDRHPVSPATAYRGWVATLGAGVVASLVLGLPGAVAKQYDRFVQGNYPARQALLRDRLTDPGANGRITLWQVARREFDDAPLVGSGAGTFAVVWAAHHRVAEGQVLDAHSVYLENLGELGIVGFALLVCIVLGSLIAVARRVRGVERTLYAAAFAAVLAWTIHAGIDWDWEMPAVTLPVFMLAGAALGQSKSAEGSVFRQRPLLGVLVLVVAVVPALVSVSQRHVDASLAAFHANDCATATSQAQRALAPLSFRVDAHQILAYCHAARGEGEPAVAEMTSAVSDDPHNWEPQYGLAIVLAAAGKDPRPAARRALALDPYETVVVDAEAQFRSDRPAQWVHNAASAPLPISGQFTTALDGLLPSGG